MGYSDFHDCEHLNVSHCSIFYTSNRVSRIFWLGTANGGIEKMRSIFFQRSKNSGVPVTQPAGWGGKSSKLTKVNLFRKVKSARKQLKGTKINN